jgi:hypothetical protein
MSSRRLSTLALLAGVVCAVAPPCVAESLAAPYVPPAPLDPSVPPQASAAIVVLREACAAWRPITLAAGPGTPGQVPAPVALPAPSQERTVCEFAVNPDQVFWQMVMMGGIAGAILFFIGLVVFSLLRGVLISAWNWRPSFGEKSW